MDTELWKDNWIPATHQEAESLMDKFPAATQNTHTHTYTQYVILMHIVCKLHSRAHIGTVLSLFLAGDVSMRAHAHIHTHAYAQYIDSATLYKSV